MRGWGALYVWTPGSEAGLAFLQWQIFHTVSILFIGLDVRSTICPTIESHLLAPFCAAGFKSHTTFLI